MKNILVLTSIYPSPDNPRGFTPVVHYFTKEWVKLGYNVKVVHNQNRFPGIYYSIPNFIKRILENILGFAIQNKKMTKEMRHDMDGVNIHRIPIPKVLPFVNFRDSVISQQVDKIVNSNKFDNFAPDYIVSHWRIPQLHIISKLKRIYNCKTSMVFHDTRNIKEKGLLEELDTIGFRSKRIEKNFFIKNGRFNNTFLCYSGISEDIICKNGKSFPDGIREFIFVGNLIQRKYPDVLIEALFESYPGEDFSLNIIGEGPEFNKLQKITKQRNLAQKVIFKGHLSRTEVLSNMSVAQCFVMISKFEAFGLVYLEAMAKGCIVVAAKNEGMDGIIKDGINGFLCEAGNIMELSYTLKKIRTKHSRELETISINAINTAKQLTEKSTAEYYLKSIK